MYIRIFYPYVLLMNFWMKLHDAGEYAEAAKAYSLAVKFRG